MRVTDDAGSFLTEFDSQTKFISNQTSPFEPTLAEGTWPNFTIYLAWTGEGDHQLNIMHANNSDPFAPAPESTVFDNSTVHLYPEFSDAGPGIAGLGRGLYLFWRGSVTSRSAFCTLIQVPSAWSGRTSLVRQHRSVL
jgi:hypothetical protein